ncbi:ABC-type nitrate/sulfonate/bicarbonate transport system substrate-binding protein [Azospirillum lipoferum]|uniref:ABC transporter substrate-binding protein n=1 Tax=Azospirillum lipoferum TaxID=193 RepID=A0A5A9GR25_AZOLI|nr:MULTISPECIES: ABC transporter substrate-binding protein [Azospirillum]KAA0596064.1 ABC transporter substrate-binding protein [Azospirillum lipoferum]MCP1611000.1 ABC-type nitrate/sulfonate/bicarbonate transport system substrate-binding protein [Azospirillum lipoferum]MDW5533867.1 ABC transporter substrate-binding protein [Azospirillum sp. NL1]
MPERSIVAARRFGRLLAAFGILCLATANSASAQDDRIRTAYRLTNTSIVVTDTDFAERYGVKIEPVKLSTGVEANEAILTGAIDVAEVGITPFVTLLSRSSDVVAIGVVSSGGGIYRTVVRTDAPYQSMDDLRGKKIAIRVGSGNYSAFLTYITQRGWKETDFQLVNSGDQEAIAALTAGSVDAVIYWEPIVSVLIAKGIARPIFSFKGVVDNPVFLVANRKTLSRSPKAFAKFVAAFMDGQEFLTNDVPAAAALVTKVMNRAGQQIDSKAIEMSIPSADYRIDLTNSVRGDAQANFQLLKKAGKLRGAEPDWAIAFDSSAIEAARQLRTK